MSTQDRQILDGIRVLDLTHIIAGPYAGYQLAALGADVVKIECPNQPDLARSRGRGAHDGRGALYRAQAVGKTSHPLDLRTKEGRSSLRAMVQTADVLIENYRVGALSTLGFGYSDVRPLNERLIYCSITGFGQTGPKAHQRAYDNVIQATSGLMSLNGTHDSWPQKIGPPIVDYATGMMAAQAITAALYDRERTGRGQHIDVSMLETALGLASVSVLSVDEDGDVARPTPKQQDRSLGLSSYQTEDGEFMLGAMTDHQLERTTQVAGLSTSTMGRDALGSRATNRYIRHQLEQVFKSASADHWVARLNAEGVPAERVRTLGEALTDPHLEARGALVPTGPGEGRVPLPGFRFSNAKIGASIPAPGMGEGQMDDHDALSKTPKEHILDQEKSHALPR